MRLIDADALKEVVKAKKRQKKEYEKDGRKETDDEATAESFARRS